MSNRSYIPLNVIKHANDDDDHDHDSLHDALDSPSTIVHLPSLPDHDDDAASILKHDDDEKHLLHTHATTVSPKRQEEDASNIHRMQRVIFICIFFFMVELVGGIWSGSLALVSDSFHLLSDAAGFGISLMAIRVSQKPATRSYTFGYHRAEVVGVLISVMLLYALTAVLLNEAWQRLEHPEPVEGKTMFVIAAIGLGVNLTMAFFLGHDHGALHSHGHHHHHHDEHDHDHGHDHGHMNINIKAAFIHILGDTLFSVGVLISSLVILKDPSKTWVDPLCTFFFSILVVATSYGLVRDSIRVLMEAVPANMDVNQIHSALMSVQGVVDVHHLHIWSLSVDKTALMVHLVVADTQPSMALTSGDLTDKSSITHRRPSFGASSAIATSPTANVFRNAVVNHASQSAVDEVEIARMEAQQILHDRFGISLTTIQVERMKRKSSPAARNTANTTTTRCRSTSWLVPPTQN